MFSKRVKEEYYLPFHSCPLSFFLLQKLKKILLCLIANLKGSFSDVVEAFVRNFVGAKLHDAYRRTDLSSIRSTGRKANRLPHVC
jgi:hypothetical protein